MIIYKKQSGFTLMELLLSTSLFVIVLGIGLGFWGSITRIQRSNLSNQKVFSESRFWVDQLAQTIQSRTIYYDSLAPYPNPGSNFETELHVYDQAGNKVRYYVAPDVGGNLALTREVMGVTPPEVLSSPETTITQFNVYISPKVLNQTQVPRVTLIWHAQDLRQQDPQEVRLQTTLGVRNY